MVDLSVCIVNWNTREHLRNCLRSIYEDAPAAACQVIVVDNASSDDSVAMVDSEFPQVRLIASTENLGFARANNRAFAVAEGRYLLMLNPDTLVRPGTFDRLVAFADGSADAGVVGPKLLNPDGSLQRSCWRGYPSLRMALVDALYLWRVAPNMSWVRQIEIPEDELKRVLEVDHVLGAAMLVRADVYCRVGGMDEGIFLFLEETEWCFRIQNSGWKVYFVPDAQIVHIGQQSVHKNPERTLPELYGNYVRFYRQHRSDSAVRIAALKGVIAMACLIRVGLWSWRTRSAAGRDHARRMRSGYATVVRRLGSY
jgi:GT2 family glycosyltransferase